MINNTGAEIGEPTKNVGRAIMISIAIVTVVHSSQRTLAVRGNLGLDRIMDARDFARGGGRTGVRLGRVQTRRRPRRDRHRHERLRYPRSRGCFGMMSDMDEVPTVDDRVTFGRRIPIGSPSLVVTTASAIFLTVTLDHADQGARRLRLPRPRHGDPLRHLRHLRDQTGAFWSAPLVAAIVVDAVVFAGFFVYRVRTDLLVIAAFLVFAVVVAGGETLYMRRFSSTDGSIEEDDKIEN
ncbi:MAG: hypothetical protein R2705_08485 [Ilumatobacteraceae bacterium]